MPRSRPPRKSLLSWRRDYHGPMVRPIVKMRPIPGASCYKRRPMLTGKQRRHLRALAHPLKPLVQVGKGGIDDGLIAAVDQALADHELIKVKVGENAGMDRHEVAEQLAGKTNSQVAQVLGNTVLLYRPDPEDPTIELPAAAKGDEPEAEDDAE